MDESCALGVEDEEVVLRVLGRRVRGAALLSGSLVAAALLVVAAFLRGVRAGLAVGAGVSALFSIGLFDGSLGVWLMTAPRGCKLQSRNINTITISCIGRTARQLGLSANKIRSLLC